MPRNSIKKDPTLQDPNCVFQLLKKHYSRYTPELVSRITGTPKEKLLEVYKLYASTGKPDKAGTSCMPWGGPSTPSAPRTSAPCPSSSCCSATWAIAGGGINALRGESNVQGSTDHGLLFHILPGYLPVPRPIRYDPAAYIEKNTPKTKDPQSANWWENHAQVHGQLSEGRSTVPRPPGE